MFDKIGRVAETMATRASLSRRGFLDRLGQGALAAVGLLGSALVISHNARGSSSSGLRCACGKRGFGCDPTSSNYYLCLTSCAVRCAYKKQ